MVRLLLLQLGLAVAMIAVWLADSQYAGNSLQIAVQPTRPYHPEVLYGVDEESAVGTTVGRGLKLDAGLVEKYPPKVLESVSFRFLSRVPDFLAISQGGQLKIVGRADREVICRTESVDGPRENDELCQVRLSVAVQPMKYFDIIKILLTIHDINDHDPVFMCKSPFVVHISESVPPGVEYSLPAAVDADSRHFAVQRYVLAAQVPQSSSFQLLLKRKPDSSLDVRLVVDRPLDRETISNYRLTLTAFDGGSPPRSVSVQVAVVVLDTNDNRPTFDRSSYDVTVDENLPIGTTVLRVHADDADDGANAVIRYHMSSSAHASYGDVFAIDEISGDIVVLGDLDFERVSVYHFEVYGIDSGPEVVTSSEVAVVVRVNDQNDNAPIIIVNTLTTSGTHVVEVAENSPSGTFVGHVTVRDADSGRNGRTSCTMTSHSAVNPLRLKHVFDTEYQLVTSKRLDHEVMSETSVTLTCADHGQRALTSDVTLAVHVLDVNDNAPRFDVKSYSADVIENSFIGTFVTKVRAVDLDSGDNGLVHYIIGNAPYNKLGREMSDISDYRRSGEKTNRQQHGNRRDGGDGRRRGQRRRNTAARRTRHEAIYVNETEHRRLDQTEVRRSRATSDDECVGRVNIDKESGVVTVVGLIDFEYSAVINCRILAIDSGYPQKTGEAGLTINVVDINDERPRFELPVYIFDVEENQSPGTQVGVVSAADRELIPFNKFTLTWRSPVDKFNIDPQTGVITTTHALDHEIQGKYEFQVIAADNHAPDLLMSTTDVTVYVTDVNDNAPEFIRPIKSSSRDVICDVIIRVPYTTSTDAVVTKVTAIDADSGINAEIVYSIESGSNSTIVDRSFVVDSSSGEVRLITALTSGDVNTSYFVAITATDAGTQPLSTSVRLCLNVVDRNVSENNLRSVKDRLLANGSLIFDSTVMSVLLGILMLCAFTFIVVSVVVIRQRRARTRPSRQLNHCKNPSHYKLVDVWNGAHDDRTEKTEQMNDNNDDDNDDDDGCSSGVPRTVIRTLDHSPRSSRASSTAVRTRRSCGAIPVCQGNSSASTCGRHMPAGHIGFNNVDGSSNV